MIRESLAKQAAAIIDRAAFSVGPETYGLKTQEEFKRTWGYAAQQVALEKARKIIKLAREPR
jgi:hypothetical protein